MQKQPKILNYKNLLLEKYEYLQPHKTSNGTYQTVCNYRLSRNELIPFYFETPKLKTTSGIVRIDNNYYIDFELPQSGDGGLFYQYLLKNDEHNITTCYQNSKDWFNQVMPLHIVENYYKTPILLRPNGQLPVFRVRLPSHKGNILTEIFNIRKEKVNDVSCIQEGDSIVGILEFSGLNFMSQNFTPCYELQKIKIYKDNDFRAIPSGYIFSDFNDKIDINDVKLGEDKIITQPIIIEKLEKFVEKVAEERTVLSNNAGRDDSNVDKPKSKSIFDIIRETTFKNLLCDDDIFLNNNKTITNKKNNIEINKVEKKKLKENKLEEKLIEEKKLEQVNTVNVNIDTPNLENISQSGNVNSNTDFKIGIQNVKNIDLNIDYELESPISSSPPQEENANTNNDTNIGSNNTSNDIQENNDTENLDSNENENENDSGSDDIIDEEDGIDYETLNDLEVIVFDE